MKPGKIFVNGISIAVMILVMCILAQAEEIPAHIVTSIPGARLAGQGNFRWFGLKIYAAQFWVGAQGFSPDKPALTPFALDLCYAHSFDGKKIAESSIKEIKKLDLGSEQQQQIWLTQMANCFPNVDEGTHLTGLFLPEQGVRYYRDGKTLCEIHDAAFAQAFFAIWLDSRTSAKGLRDELLLNAAPR